RGGSGGEIPTGIRPQRRAEQICIPRSVVGRCRSSRAAPAGSSFAPVLGQFKKRETSRARVVARNFDAVQLKSCGLNDRTRGKTGKIEGHESPAKSPRAG